MTKLSIITINRNNAAGLRKTIESVVSQTYSDFEYIIIDGASTDESVNIIKEYADKIDYWVSEPDKGIYNAMNKGIVKAKGKYLLFLNSGDWLVDESVVGDFCECKCNNDILVGNTIRINEEFISINESPNNSDFDFDYLFEKSLPHQSSFISSKLFETYGLYDEKLLISGDKEFFIRTLIKHNSTYNHLNRNIAYFDTSGISSQASWRDKLLEEDEIIYNRHIDSLVYKAYKRIYHENIKLNKKVQSLENLFNGRFGKIIQLLIRLKYIINKNKQN